LEKRFGISKSERKYETPLYKIFLLIGILTFFVFGCFLYLVRQRNADLVNAYKILESQGQKSFSTITGYHVVTSGSEKRHIYTYLVTDEIGKLHEITEFVDDKSHLKLRVGNTVVTRQKKFLLTGKERILSRIEGNNQILPNYNFLERIAFFGIGFSILISIGGIALGIFKNDFD
jgi:hypothetical protein